MRKLLFVVTALAASTLAAQEPPPSAIVDLSRELFDELNVAQNERVELANMQKRITDMNLSLEESTAQALAATFEYVRAGWK
jgi:hypothetical protein